MKYFINRIQAFKNTLSFLIQKDLIPLTLLILALNSCISTSSSNSDNGIDSNSTNEIKISESHYEEIVDQFTSHSQKYDGPYNLLEVTATLLNTKVIMAQTKRQATLFQWEANKFQSELESKNSTSKDKTEVFISFFTPDKKSGDLLRTNTLWKIILKTKNQEVVGIPKKITLLPVEITSLYPRHNRWSNAYSVSFDTPLSNVEGQDTELIITGPVGVATLQFPGLSNPVK